MKVKDEPFATKLASDVKTSKAYLPVVAKYAGCIYSPQKLSMMDASEEELPAKKRCQFKKSEK